MNKELANYLLYACLGGALIFALVAILHFREPEGSNENQVFLVAGVLLGIAMMIIYDRTKGK